MQDGSNLNQVHILCKTVNISFEASHMVQNISNIP